jgi:hypothetical protein
MFKNKHKNSYVFRHRGCHHQGVPEQGTASPTHMRVRLVAIGTAMPPTPSVTPQPKTGGYSVLCRNSLSHVCVSRFACKQRERGSQTCGPSDLTLKIILSERLETTSETGPLLVRAMMVHGGSGGTTEAVPEGTYQQIRVEPSRAESTQVPRVLPSSRVWMQRVSFSSVSLAKSPLGMCRIAKGGSSSHHSHSVVRTKTLVSSEYRSVSPPTNSLLRIKSCDVKKLTCDRFRH